MVPQLGWRARARGASSQSAARAAPCGGAQRSRLEVYTAGDEHSRREAIGKLADLFGSQAG